MATFTSLLVALLIKIYQKIRHCGVSKFNNNNLVHTHYFITRAILIGLSEVIFFIVEINSSQIHKNHLVPRNDNGVEALPNGVVTKNSLCLPSTMPEKKENPVDNSFSNVQLTQHSSPEETVHWLSSNRFEKYIQTFERFSGNDMLCMSREDLIQICGDADGIRLHNAIHLKTIAPKLKIYVCQENSQVFNAIFLSSHSNIELLQKLSSMIGISREQVRDIYIEGPHSIRVQMSNDVLQHIKEETMFALVVMQENNSYTFLLKRAVK